jgi:hypothetical protein
MGETMMGMPRGLIKLTAVANTLQAWKDWEKLACEAADAGMEDYQISDCEPNPQDGWRKIDKCIANLRAKLAQRRQQAQGE